MNEFGKLLSPANAAESVALSISYLSRLRNSGEFIKGVHYVQYGDRTYRYLSDSLFNWALHREDPEEHQRWIESQKRWAEKQKPVEELASVS